MVAELPRVVDEIEAILRERPLGGGEAISRVEETLTDGYAQALALEGERWRLERRIAELAPFVATSGASARELARLAERLAAADSDLERLRSLLGELRAHADAVRAA